MQLWLCLRLEELPLQCLPHRRPGAAAVIERQRIHTVNAVASLNGLEPGMDLSTARALSVDEPLQLLQRDPAAEEQALDALCCWAYGVTPYLYRFHDDCLMLEISGSLRLFGGADAIRRHCERNLACRGYSAAMALAETPLAAWALSRTGAIGDSGVEREADNRRNDDLTRPLKERLAAIPLPVCAPLHEQFDALQRSGLRTLGEVFALPAAALAKRCGSDFSTLLQHLGGDIVQPPVIYEPPSCFRDSYPLGYPVSDQQELGPALETLLQSLQDYLRQRQLQTRQLHWHFYGQGGYHITLEVRASDADNQWRDWYRLTQLRLERQRLEEPIEVLQLRASQLENASPVSGSLFRQAGQTTPTAHLVDLLSNRLGTQAVSSLRCRDANLPEHSIGIAEPGADRGFATPVAAQRPFWLFSEPEPLRTRADQLLFWGSALELIYGPERIEDGWWEAGTSRDYFVAKNHQGQRFWVFHERRQRSWYVHGLFA